MFVLIDVMNDNMKYFKLHTASTNVAQVAHVSVVTQYDLFTASTVTCNSNTLLPTLQTDDRQTDLRQQRPERHVVTFG